MGGIEYFAACVFDARLAQHTCIESCAALTTEGFTPELLLTFPLPGRSDEFFYEVPGGYRDWCLHNL